MSYTNYHRHWVNGVSVHEVHDEKGLVRFGIDPFVKRRPWRWFDRSEPEIVWLYERDDR